MIRSYSASLFALRMQQIDPDVDQIESAGIMQAYHPSSNLISANVQTAPCMYEDSTCQEIRNRHNSSPNCEQS